MASYDDQKASNKVHHDWITKVYTWMGYPKRVVKIIGTMIRKWRTKLEVSRDRKKEISRWIAIKCGFLQEDSFSPV